MRVLGEVAHLQVQRSPVRHRGVGFDPTPLLAVDELAVGPPGLLGRHDGGWVVDVHGSVHPQVRGGGRRALSMGFTAHYRSMAARFGDLPLGTAGENVIVDTGRRVTLQDLEDGVAVETAEGILHLGDARVAAPCPEFTSYLLGLPHVAERDEIDADLVFLGGGMRGFLFAVDHLSGWTLVRPGDRVMVGS